jgi:poly-gamma-glutamate synthesis protein (capsule biosynthesis protein)
VVAVERALAEVRATLASIPDPLPAERRQDWVRLRRAEALLVSRKEAIARVLGADLERPVPAAPAVTIPAPPPPAAAPVVPATSAPAPP